MKIRFGKRVNQLILSVAIATAGSALSAFAATDDGYGSVFYLGKGAQVTEMKVDGRVLLLTTEFGETFRISHWTNSGAKETLAEIWNGKSLNLDSCVQRAIESCVFDQDATLDLLKWKTISSDPASQLGVDSMIFQATLVTIGAECGARQSLNWVGQPDSYIHQALKGIHSQLTLAGSQIADPSKCTNPPAEH